jgi:hypothetical protein
MLCLNTGNIAIFLKNSVVTDLSINVQVKFREISSLHENELKITNAPNIILVSN